MTLSKYLPLHHLWNPTLDPARLTPSATLLIKVGLGGKRCGGNFRNEVMMRTGPPTPPPRKAAALTNKPILQKRCKSCEKNGQMYTNVMFQGVDLLRIWDHHFMTTLEWLCQICYEGSVQLHCCNFEPTGPSTHAKKISWFNNNLGLWYLFLKTQFLAPKKLPHGDDETRWSKNL